MSLARAVGSTLTHSWYNSPMVHDPRLWVAMFAIALGTSRGSALTAGRLTERRPSTEVRHTSSHSYPSPGGTLSSALRASILRPRTKVLQRLSSECQDPQGPSERFVKP